MQEDDSHKEDPMQDKFHDVMLLLAVVMQPQKSLQSRMRVKRIRQPQIAIDNEDDTDGSSEASGGESRHALFFFFEDLLMLFTTAGMHCSSSWKT